MRALIDQYGINDLPAEELEVAEAKDAARKIELKEALEEELARVGVRWDLETHRVAFFQSGKATMTILEVFQGDAEVGDEIAVVWESVLFRWSCPPILPFEGVEAGWILPTLPQKQDALTLGHGFYGREDAREALANFRKGNDE